MYPVSEGAKLRTGAMSSGIDAHLVSSSPRSEILLASGSLESHWYAAYTCPRHEKSVAKQLEGRQIICFLPLYQTWHRWADRRKQIELALFPGYVFVRIPLVERMRVLELPGVVRLVSFDGRPAPLPDQEIEGLRNGLEHGVYAQPHPYLRTGRRVHVVRGPLAGTQGILVRRKDKSRFVISVDVLMRSVSVELDATDLAPAN